jgi:hypothetical protein
MTFNQLVTKTMDRLNLSSDASRTRIGERINEAYFEITSTIGLNTSRRVETTFTLNTSVDTDLPVYEVLNYEKILRIMLVDSDSVPTRLLEEVQYDDVVAIPLKIGLPTQWAVKSINATTVTIVLNGCPDATDFTISIDGYFAVTELVEDIIPAIPESFHDLLIEHALFNELRKLEKDKLAEIAQARFEKRLSDLRMFLAKSAYLNLQQNATRNPYSTIRRFRSF